MTQDELLKAAGVYIASELKKHGHVLLPEVGSLVLVPARQGKTYSPMVGSYVKPRYTKRVKFRPTEVFKKNVCNS